MKDKGYKWDEADWDHGSIRKEHFIVHRPDYPGCYKNGQAKRAHVVYWLKTGMAPAKGEDIHHVNENPLDDRFENLKLIPHGEHSKLHMTKPMQPLVCTHCGKEYFLPAWRVRQKEKIGTLEYFCSMPCRAQHKWNENTKKLLFDGAQGANARSKERADTKLFCDHCGKEYHILASALQARKRAGNHGFYCSLECKYKHGMSEEQKKILSVSLSKAYAEGRR
jgi:hypothetical protein